MADGPHRRMTIASGALLLAMTLLLAWCGYYQIFSRFQPYDDEGCILLNTRQVAEGEPLYDRVHALYGPWFYFTNIGLHRLGLFPFTHDGNRLLTLALWLASSLLTAAIVYGLTSNALLAPIAAVLMFTQLHTLANEPGHPLAWLNVLLLLLPVVLLGREVSASECGPGRAAALGVLLAFLVLTKVNVGIFAGAAVAHLFLAGLPGRFASGARWLLTFALLLLPLALMRRDLPQPWAVVYLLTATLAMLPVLCWRYASPAVAWRDVLAAALGFTVGIAAVVGIAVGCGTSLHGVLHGVVLQHLGMPFSLPLPAEGCQAVFAGAGLAAWLGHRALQRRQPTVAHVALNVGKLLFFLVVLHNVVAEEPAVLLLWALPFAWLGLATEGDPSLARRLLVTLTVLQALVAYPVAGSQKVSATMLLVPTALVCLGDALGALASAGFAWANNLQWRTLAGASVAALLLLYQGKKTADYRSNYAALPRLDLPGAGRVHLPEEYVALYRWLAANLDAHADVFYTQPGMNSLYFWTNQQPPTDNNTTHWMVSFTPEQQAEIVARLRDSPNSAAVVSEPWTDFWLAGRTPPDGSLLHYLRDGFQTVGTVHGFAFRTRRDQPLPTLIGCVRLLTTPNDGPWTGAVYVPPVHQPVSRMAVVDLSTGRTFATTAKPLDLDPHCHYAYRVHFTPDATASRPNLALRLYSGDQWLTTLPFLD